MLEASPANAESRQRILLIGHGPLVDVARRALDDAGAESVHLEEPADSDIRTAVTTGVDAVLVVSRDDRVALRYGLVVEHLLPGVRLIVTIYNRDLAVELRRAVPNVRVMSMADIVAPSLAAACVSADLLTARRAEGAGSGFARAPTVRSRPRSRRTLPGGGAPPGGPRLARASV